MLDIELGLTGKLRGCASPDADRWTTAAGIEVAISGEAATVKWLNPPIDNDAALTQMANEVQDRPGAQFVRTGACAGVTWGMATVRSGSTTSSSVQVNVMIAAVEKAALSSLADFSHAGDTHPEFRTALGLLCEAAAASQGS
jgi:hypothetical protein